MEWSSSWPESVSSYPQTVKDELIRGREVGNDQLRRVKNLDDNRSLIVNGGDDVGSANHDQGLVSNVLGSFSSTLFISNIGKKLNDDQELISNQIDQFIDGHFDPAIKCEDSHEEGCKNASKFKDLRGSYKRRRTSHSWTRDSPELIDDGHAWRKYGQKAILDAKHSRSYFRCTHKFDQACKATKHVQKIQDDPPVFRTTYYGNHSCKDYLTGSELVLDCTSPRQSSNLIRFDNTNQDHPFFSSFTSVKKEAEIKKEVPSDHMIHYNQPSSCDYRVSPDLTAFESPGPVSLVSSTMDQLDYENAHYRIMMESCDFDDEVFGI